MKIGTHSRFSTMDNKYRVHWGITGNAYNNQHRSFVNRSDATRFANTLKKRFGSKYKISYVYAS